MKKKILAAVMAATMVFSLVACGSSDAGSSAAIPEAAATDTASAGAYKHGCIRRSDQGSVSLTMTLTSPVIVLQMIKI